MSHHRSSDITWPYAADNGDTLTYAEGRAIRDLHMLARRWPQTLKLVSMDGGLQVIRNGDPRFDIDYGTGPERQQCVLADICGIPNDGGAW